MLGQHSDRDGLMRRVTAAYAQAERYVALGLQFAASILLGVGAGYWLDVRLGTGPVLLLAGAFGGAVAGFWAMYRSLMDMEKRQRPDGDDCRSGKAGPRPDEEGVQ